MAKPKAAALPVEEGVDLGTSPEGEENLASLEEKYRDQMRQIFPTKIDLPLFTLKTQIEEQIDLRPEFQRRDRWNDEKRSRFIESLIMNVPVPPVFLGEEEYAKYVVLDGRQRLKAIYDFLCNQLRLCGLRVWTELNGDTYAAIKKKGFAPTIERRFLPAILLTRESSPEVKYDVFDRLNTGGVIAKPMEVRNAIFPGEFNGLLHELSADSKFRQLWGIPDSKDLEALEKNSLYREMADLELVLRFFALRDATLRGMRYKDFMSDFMSKRNADYERSISLRQVDAALFHQATRNCLQIFDMRAFIKPGGETGRRSAPYSDAVMQALADHAPEVFTTRVSQSVREGFDRLAEDPEFQKAISTGTNGESAIKNRIQLAREVVKAVVEGRQTTRGHGLRGGRR
ncbi:MAG: DUF262 domain-containing protein [Thermoanaerobaculia bacterium]|nr:DUF262 domain-containing protein [Thermoanaerobaculia bacterium]